MVKEGQPSRREREEELRQVSAEHRREEELRLYGRSVTLGGALVLIGDVSQVIGPFNAALGITALIAFVIGGGWLWGNRIKLRRLSDRHASLKATLAAMNDQN